MAPDRAEALAQWRPEIFSEIFSGLGYDETCAETTAQARRRCIQKSRNVRNSIYVDGYCTLPSFGVGRGASGAASLRPEGLSPECLGGAGDHWPAECSPSQRP